VVVFVVVDRQKIRSNIYIPRLCSEGIYTTYLNFGILNTISATEYVLQH
jgi:hypothetical protein